MTIDIISTTMQKKSKQQSKKQKQQRKQQQKQTSKPTPQEEKNQSDPEQQYEDFDLNQIQVQDQEQVQVDFVVAQLNEEYYHSLKTILLRYSIIGKCNQTELADAVLTNKQVGNITLAEDDQEQEEQEDEEDEGQEDEDNVYSVLTILPGGHKVSKAIKQTALTSLNKQPKKAQISDLLNNPSTSILINQRLTNLPPIITSSYHEVFKKDLQELKSKNKTLYNQLCSGYLLLISEVQLEGKKDLESIVYSQFEMYEFCQKGKYWWTGVSNPTHKKKAQLVNLYCLIKAQDYLKAVDNIKKYLE